MDVNFNFFSVLNSPTGAFLMKPIIYSAILISLVALASNAQARSYTFRDIDQGMDLHYGHVTSVERADMARASPRGQ